MARCRGCQAEIDFVTLRSGKKMPVESATPETYRVFLRPAGGAVPVTLVTQDGDILRAYLAPTSLIGPRMDQPVTIVTGYESHFATCPQAETFRR